VYAYDRSLSKKFLKKFFVFFFNYIFQLIYYLSIQDYKLTPFQIWQLKIKNILDKQNKEN